MANLSTSTSTSTSHGTTENNQYEVFISHRGPDRTFANPLYDRLTRYGLRVFLAERELQKGDYITRKIKSAIGTSSVHIAIFSPGYADSTQCLDELVFMLQSMRNSGSTIIPVFYGVFPPELHCNRGNNGVYARSLCVLEEKKKYDGRPTHDSSIIEKWRNTLSEVAKIKGFSRETDNGDEQFLEGVVEVVLKFVRRPLPVAKYRIGLEEKFEGFETIVRLQRLQQQSRNVRVIGIVGPGGVGKTTLAKEIFNRQRSNYKRSCFLFDIGGKSLTQVQSDLLKDLTCSNIQIQSVDEGMGKLERYLSSSHALIILDDVDHLWQLEALLFPLKTVLHPESLILVISRDKHILASAGIRESSIYSLKGLSEPHSRELFCRYAFNQSAPPEGFHKVVEKFLGACQGLPLSIKVLGALLRGTNDLDYWEEQFRKLSTIIPDDIQSRLKISYDSLYEKEQHMFLDIACFFPVEDRDTVVRTWNGCGWVGRQGLRILENRSLVEVDDQNRVRMLNPLKALGRALAGKELPGCMLRFSGPSNEVDDLSGLAPVRGISMVHGNDPEQCFNNLVELAGSSLASSMRSLQLLRAEGCFVESLLSVGQLPKLIYLRWENCTNSSLASSIPKMTNLRVLYIQGVNLKTLWDRESEAPVHLTELYIDAPLEDVPTSIGKLRHLEKFVLCQSYLETLPDELCHINSLKHLDLKYCEKLRLLPDSIGSLASLRNLLLGGCSTLQTLPDSVANLKGLQILCLDGCSSLGTLPDSFGNLTRLQILRLDGCSTLQTLPESVRYMTSLQVLRLDGCPIQTFPDWVGGLTGLQNLRLDGCSNLQMLPDSLGNLTGLQILGLGGCSSLQALPLTIGKLMGLRRLALGWCSNLQALPDSVGLLTSLRSLDLGWCSTLQSLPDSVGSLTDLRSLDLYMCSSLQTLPDSVSNLTALQSLDLGGCSTLKTLPDWLGNMTGLRSLNLGGCSTLPTWVGKLTGLESLDLDGSSTLQTLPDWIGNLRGLRSLDMGGCSKLQTLPDRFEEMTGLQSLNLNGCSDLQTLPDSIGNLTGLEDLDLSLCSTLQKLPHSVRYLTRLEYLYLNECSNLQELPNVSHLRSLKKLDLSGCSKMQLDAGVREQLLRRGVAVIQEESV